MLLAPDYGPLLHVSVRMVRVREKVFGNNKGSRFNVSFVDWTSEVVKSDLEASLSFTNIMLTAEVTFSAAAISKNEKTPRTKLIQI